MNNKSLIFLLTILTIANAIDFDALEKASTKGSSVSVDFSDANRAGEKKHNEVQNKQKTTINKFMSSIAASRGNYVMINFDTTCGLLATCTDHKLSITGSPGTFSSGAGGSGAIHKGYNGKVAGTYHYIGSFKRNGSWRSCSGSFRLSGIKQNYGIRVYEDCRDASSGEY